MGANASGSCFSHCSPPVSMVGGCASACVASYCQAWAQLGSLTEVCSTRPCVSAPSCLLSHCAPDAPAAGPAAAAAPAAAAPAAGGAKPAAKKEEKAPSEEEEVRTANAQQGIGPMEVIILGRSRTLSQSLHAGCCTIIWAC